MRILGSNIPINRSLLEYMHQLKPKELVVYLVLIIHVLEYKPLTGYAGSTWKT